jgi:hypothetical protein
MDVATQAPNRLPIESIKVLSNAAVIHRHQSPKPSAVASSPARDAPSAAVSFGVDGMENVAGGGQFPTFVLKFTVPRNGSSSAHRGHGDFYV